MDATDDYWLISKADTVAIATYVDAQNAWIAAAIPCMGNR
jgi:hypothetical protein